MAPSKFMQIDDRLIPHRRFWPVKAKNQLRGVRAFTKKANAKAERAHHATRRTP